MSDPASFRTDEEILASKKNSAEKLAKKTSRIIPANDLDAMYLTLDPDYQSTIEAFNTEPYALIFKAIKSGYRLGNLTAQQTELCEYDFQTASECFDLGLETSAIAFLSDITARCEFSQSKKGFRSKMLATIRQEVYTNQTGKKGKNVIGGSKEE